MLDTTPPQEQEVKFEEEVLVDRARSGELLIPDDRRKAVAFLLKKGDVSIDEMAVIFQCSTKTIRRDKAEINSDSIEETKNDSEVNVVINNLLAARDKALVNLRKAIKKAVVGTPNYLNYEKAILEIEMKTTQQLQDLGVLPKNLGTVTVKKIVWRAVVAFDGSVKVHRVTDAELNTFEDVKKARPADLFTDIREGETLEQSIARRRQERKALLDAQPKVLPPAALEETDGTDGTTQPEPSVRAD